MADYCTTTDLQSDIPDSPLATSTDAGLITALGNMITAASRLIDMEVGRWPNYFYPTSDDATRYFDGSGEREQEIDEAVSITSVSVAESGGVAASDYTAYTLNTDYILWPYNSIPTRKLILLDESNKSGWVKYRKCVKVIGIFGYSLTPPEDIKRACMIQSWRWYMRAKQNWQDAGVNSQMAQVYYLQELDPDVKLIVAHYRLESMT